VVTFASGSGALDTEAEGALALVAEELKLNSKWKVLVVGFADKVGETAAGETLGSKRAQSVSNRLKTIGVPQERLHAQSLGSAYAEGDQWTKGAQKQDRRAEVWAFWE
jgi:outer membrane protein OmpA-like peptidoglycan-associated protein